MTYAYSTYINVKILFCRGTHYRFVGVCPTRKTADNFAQVDKGQLL